LGGRPNADAAQCTVRSDVELDGSVKNLVGEMDQMFRRHREPRIVGVSG
jgi:hypothetical protein